MRTINGVLKNALEKQLPASELKFAFEANDNDLIVFLLLKNLELIHAVSNKVTHYGSKGESK